MKPITKGYKVDVTNDDAAAALGIKHYPGYRGSFSRDQHPLALYENGARVVKAEDEDETHLHPIGTLGTVLGSIGHVDIGVAYFVEFDSRPKHAVLVLEGKLKRHA